MLIATLTNDVVTKVVSSLAGAAALAIITYYWRNVIVVFWEDRSYSGEEIAGKWRGTAHTPAGESLQEIELKRKGYRVFGNIKVIGGAHPGQSYEFEGTYRSTMLTATYIAERREVLDRGSFTLMLLDGGAKLVGGEAAYITAEHRVGHFEYEWIRT